MSIPQDVQAYLSEGGEVHVDPRVPHAMSWWEEVIKRAESDGSLPHWKHPWFKLETLGEISAEMRVKLLRPGLVPPPVEGADGSYGGQEWIGFVQRFRFYTDEWGYADKWSAE